MTLVAIFVLLYTPFHDISITNEGNFAQFSSQMYLGS